MPSQTLDGNVDIDLVEAAIPVAKFSYCIF